MIAEEKYLSSYIKISQYLANLSFHANPFEEIRRILKSELGPRNICFFTSSEIERSVECHEGCCNRGTCPLPNLFHRESVEVMEDEFISTTVVDATPESESRTLLSVIFLSLPVKHHPRCVVSVAYEGEVEFNRKTLDLYLGIAGIMATALDRITDEKERIAHLAARQKISQDLAVAEATLRTRKTFYASISHDIRSPIAAIQSLCDLLLEDDPRSEQEELLRAIHESTDGLLSLLSDVMDFSRMEVGKMSIRSVPFNPMELAGEIKTLLTEQARQKSLTFECKTELADPGPYLGDPLRIRQILMNLLTNAIKFTSDGGVTLEVQTEVTTDSRDLLHFIVADTGIGIPDEKLKRIFGSFEQADDETTAQFGGSGLGLAISKALVERMHGQIEVDSSPEGSCFRVSIPLERAV